jgi:hypothetical protein
MNMKSQCGAVLAFSLVMLLLLTLAATRMIQQNKQQLEMGNSARLLTQQFANTEGGLANAKNMINGILGKEYMKQHIDPTGTPINSNVHQCIPLSSYKQNIALAGLVPITEPNTIAIILTSSCMSLTGNITPCTSYDASNSKLTCYPKIKGGGGMDCTGKSVVEIAALFNDSTDLCYQPYDPQCDEDVSTTINPRCLILPPVSLPTPSCPKEVYKIDVISTDANGTTREIISDHVVGCGT